MSGRTFSFTTKAYLTSYHTPDEITPESAACALSFYNFSSTPDGYTLVGEADITVRVVDAQKIIANKVEALKTEKARVLAEAQMKATDIEANIQKLLAISFDEGVA